MQRARRLLAAALAAGTAGLLAPAAAQAHGFVGKADIPVPVWLFAWAAAVVLVLSFVALAVLWPEPRLEGQQPRPARWRLPGMQRARLVPLPPIVDVVLGAAGIFLFGVTVYSGLAGTQEGIANWSLTFIYVIFWVGGVFASLLFGDFFRLMSPWRALARGVSWLANKLTKGELPAPIAYPRWLGRWPAAVSVGVFAWVELVYNDRDTPTTLAVMAIAYAAFQLVAMSLFGIEAWSDNGDGFGVYFGLFARLAPWARRDGQLWWRRPLSGVTELTRVPGTVALLCVMLGSTTFDGASNGPLWNSEFISQGLLNDFVHLGFSTSVALELAFTVGLLACILFCGLLYRLGIAGVRYVGGTLRDGRDAGSIRSGRFALAYVHSLVPIAAAYVIVHYFSYLVFNGQAIISLASDPLGNGANIFGTSQVAVNYKLIGPTAVWYVQIAVLIVGHVCGLVLAHDRATVLYQRPRDAARSQGWMLVVMVGFTSLALFLISAANSR